MKINFAEPMPHENNFSGRADAENKLSVQTKFPLSESNGRPLAGKL